MFALLGWLVGGLVCVCMQAEDEHWCVSQSLGPDIVTATIDSFWHVVRAAARMWARPMASRRGRRVELPRSDVVLC
jgi:hypothetical protein